MLHTAAEVLTLAKKLESESAKFYENLAQRYTEGKEISLSFAKENSKYIVQVERAYYEVITDAIEGCFSFEGIDTDNYSIETELLEGTSYSDALRMAIALEEKIIKFYLDTAKVSKSLMADVPRAFEMVAKKRNERIPKLRSLLKEG